MSTLPPGTQVRLSPTAASALSFPPPPGDLTVVVHPRALHARQDPHTQVACLADGSVLWLGALGEDLLERSVARPDPAARAACAARLLLGARLWEVVRPGPLVLGREYGRLSTVYTGSAQRPWLVLGETEGGELIAAPLNEPSNPKSWTPLIRRESLSFAGHDKDALLELAHLWTLPATTPPDGSLLPAGRFAIEAALLSYFEIW